MTVMKRESGQLARLCACFVLAARTLWMSAPRRRRDGAGVMYKIVAAGIAAGCMEQQHLGWFWQWQQQHRGLQVPMSFFSVSRSPPPAESAA